MTEKVNPELLELLACPDCGGALETALGYLECSKCLRAYDVSGGIPLLFPADIDREHIEEEEKLGDLMKDLPPEEKNAASEIEWERSKDEFWAEVAGALGGGVEKTIINVGCGIDRRFLDLAPGSRLVAFDLMLHLLELLRDEHGSGMNVAGAVQALPFRKGSFDCVCCIDLVHHEPDDLETIVESFHSILKPGGLLFLEDINAWGLFQIWKSILLPRRLHGALRSLYHRLRRSPQQPAPYEFPTSVFRTKKILARAGFVEIEAVPQEAYPNVPSGLAMLYRALGPRGRLQSYHNFHYLLRARKAV